MQLLDNWIEKCHMSNEMDISMHNRIDKWFGSCIIDTLPFSTLSSFHCQLSLSSKT